MIKSSKCPHPQWFILFVSFSNLVDASPNREISRGLNSTAVMPLYRKGGCSVPVSSPDCSDSHELETLMSPGRQELGQQPAEEPEAKGLMASANPGEGEDASASEPKVNTCEG